MNYKELSPKAHPVVWDKQKIADYWNVFGNIDPVSPWFSVKASGFILDELKKLRPLINKDKIKILDIGSGSGDLLNKISSLSGFECFGIDLSPMRVEGAKTKFPHINFQVGSLTESGYPAESFDIVISTQTIEHLLDEDLELAFKEMSRILKPSGLTFLTTRYEEDLTKKLKVCPDCHCIFLHSQHMQSFSEKRMSNILKGVGCEPVILKKSTCRNHLNDYIPRVLRFMDKFMFSLFHDFFDRRKGKYLYAVGQKKIKG